MTAMGALPSHSEWRGRIIAYPQRRVYSLVRPPAGWKRAWCSLLASKSLDEQPGNVFNSGCHAVPMGPAVMLMNRGSTFARTLSMYDRIPSQPARATFA